MKLRVRNFLGVRQADIDLASIVLVAGLNAAGKSSLCEAAACVVCNTPLARGMTSRKAAAALLRRGADKGSISLDYDGGAVRITYPSCEVEQVGKPLSLGTPLGIGSAKFMALKPEERSRQIAERFDTKPTIEDLRSWAAEHPEAGLAPYQSDVLHAEVDPVADLWNDIDVQGWDAIWKQAAEHGTKLKGRWEAISGQKWGAKAAKEWCPSPLLPGEEYNATEARQAASAAQAELETLLRHAGAAAADIQKLEEAAAGLEAAQARSEELRKEGLSLAKQLEDLVAKKNSDKAPVDTSTLPECPHCQKKIRIVTDPKQRYTILEKAPAPLSKAELTKARAAIEELDRQIRAMEQKVQENGAAGVVAARAFQEAKEARRRLLEVQATPRVADAEVETARGKMLDAERKAQAVENLQKATGIYRDWTRHVVLTDGLSPDGVRRTVMMRKLSAINAQLGEFSATAKFADVVLTDDLDCTYDDRPYALLSESERWRVDLVLACLLGQREGAKLMIVDRFDVLNPQARPGVLMMLRHVGIPALVTMTAREKSAIPDLEKARIGTTRWLADGTLEAN